MNTQQLEQCRKYLLAHARERHAGSSSRPPLRAVTISRQTGAGGAAVAQELFRYFETRQNGNYPWAIFDRELVKRVLNDHGLPEAFEQYMPEDSAHRINDLVEDLLGLHPSASTLVQHVNHTILRLAMIGNVIIVGRGSHLITASMAHVFHVRLVAPLETRIRRIMEREHLRHAEASDLAHKSDQAKVRYIRRNFRSRIWDPLQFHLTINTGRMEPLEVAKLVGDAVLSIP